MLFCLSLFNILNLPSDFRIMADRSLIFKTGAQHFSATTKNNKPTYMKTTLTTVKIKLLFVDTFWNTRMID